MGWDAARSSHSHSWTLLVGRDKLEVSAASLKIRYNDMDVVVNEDQPLEVHHADYYYQSSSRPSIGVYKVRFKKYNKTL